MILALLRHMELSLTSIEDMARISVSGDSRKCLRWIRVSFPSRGLLDKSRLMTLAFARVSTLTKSSEIDSSERLFLPKETR